LCENGEFEGKKQASIELAEQIGKGLMHHQRKNVEAANGKGLVIKLKKININNVVPLTSKFLYFILGTKIPEYPNYQEKTASAWYISGHLLMLKMLNMLCVICQIYLLTKFLGSSVDSDDAPSPSISSPNSTSHDYWGFSIVCDLISGRKLRHSAAFPRVCFQTSHFCKITHYFQVTFCDFYIRQPQPDRPPQRYTLQCVLMVILGCT
jgi:hypothetical protein